MGYDVERGIQDVFLYFLDTGTLPRETRNQNLHSIQEHLLEHVRKSPHFFGAPAGGSTFCNTLLHLLQQNHAALPRLLSQFGDVLLEDLFDHTTECGIVSRWISLLSHSTEPDLKSLKWRVVFYSLGRTGGKISMEAYPRVEKEILLCLLREVPAAQLFRWVSHLSAASLSKLMNELDVPRDGESLEKVLERIQEKVRQVPLSPSSNGKHQVTFTPTDPSLITAPWEIYIDNAGIVLLHAYLPALFEALGCWDGSQCVSEIQLRIILLIQDLTRPADLFPEYQLLLNKLLCGYHAKSPLPLCLEENVIREYQLVSEVLESLQREWTLNGVPVNPTIESLRESFLQRQGKLIRRENDWLLRVEQKAYDLVLNSLPWSIRTIRLPWMEETLWVEWI